MHRLGSYRALELSHGSRPTFRNDKPSQIQKAAAVVPGTTDRVICKLSYGTDSSLASDNNLDPVALLCHLREVLHQDASQETFLRDTSPSVPIVQRVRL